jgi:hypothetical protein
MDSDVEIVDDLGIVASPWTGWSPWERAHDWFNADGLPITGVWRSYRTRGYTDHWQVTHRSQRCGPVCPPGYAPDNGSCAGAAEAHVIDGAYGPTVSTTVPHVSATHFVEVQDSVEDIVNRVSWEDTQWRFIFGEDFYPGLSHALSRSGHKRASLALPDMIHSDLIVLGTGMKGVRARLNHREPDDTLAAIRCGSLPPGVNFLNLVSGEGDEAIDLQLQFSVVAPIELLVEQPVVAFRPTNERNGHDVVLRIRNRSLSQHAVRLQCSSAPPGWMGLLLGEPVRVVEPGRENEVVLRVERINGSARVEEHLPFTVCMTSLDSAGTEVAAVVYVKALSPDDERM